MVSSQLRSQLLSRPAPNARVAENPPPTPAPHVAEDRSASVDVPAPIENNASTEPPGRDADDDIPAFLRQGAVDAAIPAHGRINKPAGFDGKARRKSKARACPNSHRTTR